MLTRIPVAFLAGLISVVTPCVLPLVPGYLSAVSAVEADRFGQPGHLEPETRETASQRAEPFALQILGAFQGLVNRRQQHILQHFSVGVF